MLQFNMTVCSTAATRFTSRLLWRLNAALTTNAITVTCESSNANAKEPTSGVTNNKQQLAFNEFKTKLCSDFKINPPVTMKIETAQNIHEVLQVIQTPLLPKDVTLKALEFIATWVNKNNEKSGTKDVISSTYEQYIQHNDDIDNDLSVYKDLSTSEMIKTIYKLAQAGERNIILLNYLFENIIEHNQTLSTGACSNLMYSMSILNYSDERLLKKICTDLINIKKHLPNHIPITTLISIVKSMAMVRYKNNVFLEEVCKNIIYYYKLRCKPKQIANLLLSFATLGYYSQYIDEIMELYMPQLEPAILGDIIWLNTVWAFTVFKRASKSNVMSVLNEKFVLDLMSSDLKGKLSHQLKLLNIDAYARYALKDYSGPFLNTEIIPPIVHKRSNQKESFINTLDLTLKHMLPSTSHYKMNVNSNMGFCIDALLYLNSDFKPVPVDNQTGENFTKIAIMMVDYYDMCLGESDYQGLIKLHSHLLSCNKYEVLCISYQNFGIEDKLERRISYLRHKIQKKFNKSF